MAILPQGGAIYTITNTVSNTIYVGQTICGTFRRWNQHKHRLNQGTHTNPYLQNAWNKYGASAFEFAILEAHDTLEAMNDAERHIIEYFRYIGVRMYNSKQGGDNGRHSEESKQKRRGRKMPEEARAKMRGRKHTDEARRKMSEANTRHSGKVFKVCSPEGVSFESNNLNEFCRDHDLNIASLWHVLYTDRTHHKGWTKWQDDANARQQAIEAAERQRAPKLYQVVSPDGKIFTTNDMRALCREYDLNPSHMCNVAQGKKNTHKGWTRYEADKD